MKASRPKGKGGKDKDDSDEMLAVTKPSKMGMAGTPDKSPSRDAQQLEIKESAPSGLLARLRGSPDSKAVEANELDAGHREAQNYPKEALTMTSIAEAAVNAMRKRRIPHAYAA
eukprot:6194534-Pleurochrysis_carterae.AAC.2